MGDAADRARAVVARAEALVAEIMDHYDRRPKSSWQARVDAAVTALHAERAAGWREAAAMVEAMIEPQRESLDTGNLWRRSATQQIAAALRARAEEAEG